MLLHAQVALGVEQRGEIDEGEEGPRSAAPLDRRPGDLEHPLGVEDEEFLHRSRRDGQRPWEDLLQASAAFRQRNHRARHTIDGDHCPRVVDDDGSRRETLQQRLELGRLRPALPQPAAHQGCALSFRLHPQRRYDIGALPMAQREAELLQPTANPHRREGSLHFVRCSRVEELGESLPDQTLGGPAYQRTELRLQIDQRPRCIDGEREVGRGTGDTVKLLGDAGRELALHRRRSAKPLGMDHQLLLDSDDGPDSVEPRGQPDRDPVATPPLREPTALEGRHELARDHSRPQRCFPGFGPRGRQPLGRFTDFSSREPEDLLGRHAPVVDRSVDTAHQDDACSRGLPPSPVAPAIHRQPNTRLSHAHFKPLGASPHHWNGLTPLAARYDQAVAARVGMER